MKTLISILFILVGYFGAYCQPAHDNCNNPISLPSGKSFCSADQNYTTVGATPSLSSSGSDIWFSFTPRDGYDLFVTVYGEGNGGTLKNPAIKLFFDCPTVTGVTGSSNTLDNVTTFYTGSLTIGHTYYISVSGTNTGSFKLCFQNQTAAVKPGQDCATARFLCSKDPVRETAISGSGANPDEGVGSCLKVLRPDGTHPNTESNSAWYKWVAQNNGTLVFTITPTVTTDDLDWALFDLGIAGNCNNKVAIRCANGSGVKNHLPEDQGGGCPNEPNYYKTGLDFKSSDITETAGCGQGQDGKVKFVDMEKDHVYALVINNPYSQGNGFILDFKDQTGAEGTGIFAGPQAVISAQDNNLCAPNQSFTFKSDSKFFNGLKWNFGEGASVQTATTAGPFSITYATKGTKTVTLEALGDNGCFTLDTRTFNVNVAPGKPDITVNKPIFCMKDTIRLAGTAPSGLIYKWTGPNNFTSDKLSVEIPIASSLDAGIYTLQVFEGGCGSELASITVPPIHETPIASFSTSPSYPARLSSPITVNFSNESKNADTYLWDFGDGTTSTELSPTHIYRKTGQFDVSLTVFKTGVCEASIIHGKFVITADNTVFVPNTFTPNNDGFNDEFVVTIPNVSTYSIKIFNRWGSEVFISKDTFDNWKGTRNGEQLPAGTYFYVIDAQDFNGKSIKLSGYITLLR